MPAGAAAKSLQSCPTLCDPIDGSPPGSPVPGILQARILSGLPLQSEVAQLCSTLANSWTAAYQAPPSMGFSRQEYWSGVPLPSQLYLGHWNFTPCFLLAAIPWGKKRDKS